MNTEEIPFRFSGKMARLLGRESVSSETAALFELVKNAYDADAEETIVTFQDFKKNNGKNAKIIISDLGDGMTKTDIEDKWMVIGTYSKERKPFSRTKHRRVTGNKGVGRFATEKLSKKTTIITKSYSKSEECTLIINWSKYEKEKITFDQVLNSLKVNSKISRRSGTTIILEELRDTWTAQKIENFQRDVSSLILPKELQKIKNDPFKVNIVAPDFEIKHPIDIQSSLFEIAPYRIESSISNGKFTAPVNIFRKDKLDHDEMLDFKDIEMYNGEIWMPFGKCKITIYYFPRSSEYEKWDEHYRKKGMKLNLMSNRLSDLHGVKIYRDGFWVRPYGDKDNDWIGLEQKRVMANLRVGNTQVVAFVEISKDENPLILDTTTRERLVENNAFVSLKTYVEEVFETLFQYRVTQNEKYKSKDVKTTHESSIESEVDKVKKSISELVELDPTSKSEINESVQSVAKVFKEYREQIEKNTKEIKESERAYRNLASLGISSATTAHEIGHIIPHLSLIPKNVLTKLRSFPEAKDMVYEDLERATQKINAIIHFTSFIISFAENLAHDTEIGQRKELFNPVLEINNLLNDLSGILEQVGIEIYLPLENNTKIRMNKSDFHSIILNLFSNSVKALKKIDKKYERKIKVSTTRDARFFKIKFSDNGPGISEINKKKIFRMFFTTNKRGTGLGLTIVKEILEEYAGKIELREKSEYDHGVTFQVSLPIEVLK